MRANPDEEFARGSGGLRGLLVAVVVIAAAIADWFVGRGQPWSVLHVRSDDACTAIRSGTFRALPPVFSGVDRAGAEVVDADGFVHEVVQVNIHLICWRLKRDVD